MTIAQDFHVHTVALWDKVFGPNDANLIASSFKGERLSAYGIFNGEPWFTWRFPDGSIIVISKSGSGIKP